MKKKQLETPTLSHRIHVWYIYLHLQQNQPNVGNIGKSTIHGSYANLIGEVPNSR